MEKEKAYAPDLVKWSVVCCLFSLSHSEIKFCHLPVFDLFQTSTKGEDEKRLIITITVSIKF